MTTEPKSMMFILREPPYQSQRPLEAVEAILVAGAFGQRVSMLFKDDGVWQLLANQDGASIGRTTIAKMLQALPEYDIDEVFVCKRSLEERQLAIRDLALAVKPVSGAKQKALLEVQDMVVSI